MACVVCWEMGRSMSLGLLEKVGGGGGTHRALGGVHWRQWPGQVKGCRGDRWTPLLCREIVLLGWVL